MVLNYQRISDYKFPHLVVATPDFTLFTSTMSRQSLVSGRSGHISPLRIAQDRTKSTLPPICTVYQNWCTFDTNSTTSIRRARTMASHSKWRRPYLLVNKVPHALGSHDGGPSVDDPRKSKRGKHARVDTHRRKHVISVNAAPLGSYGSDDGIRFRLSGWNIIGRNSSPA